MSGRVNNGGPQAGPDEDCICELHRREECPCEFHQPQGCPCRFHRPPQENDCQCPYHRPAASAHHSRSSSESEMDFDNVSLVPSDGGHGIGPAHLPDAGAAAVQVNMSHTPGEIMLDNREPHQNVAEGEARDVAFAAMDDSDEHEADDEDHNSTISDLIEEVEDYQDSRAFNVVGSSDDSDNPDDPGMQDSAHLQPSLHGPEDPHDSDPEPGDSDPEDNFEDSDISYGGNQNVSIGNPNLNATVQFFEGCTLREGVAMVTALSIRKHLDYETTMHQFAIMNLVTGLPQFPTDKRQLWRLLGLNNSGVRKHAYCRRCQRSLGRVKNLQPGTVCCGIVITPRNVKYFITLPLKQQFKRLLDTPGAADRLSHREGRVKKVDGAIEDIYDGAGYKRLIDLGLRPPYDLTYTANWDGFSVSNAGKNSGWGLMLRVNELRPNLRQKNVILCAFWVDTQSPRFDLFLRKFVREANRLSAQGVTWKPDGVNDVTSRIFPTVCPLDSIARCGALSMTQFNGLYGCTFCEHPGVSVDGVWKYPLPGTVVVQHTRRGVREVAIPEDIPLRTHETIQEAMAVVEQERVMGIIEPSELADLDFFDLARGFSTDDLHPIYIGTAQSHTALLLRQCRNMAEAVRIIDARYTKMQLPSVISRKPRPFSQRGQWNGAEWRNWLLYGGVPCLQGLLPQHHINLFGLLAKGAFIASRDIITEAQAHEAERAFTEYQTLMQRHHGNASMKFLVHELGHVMECVRQWGSLWCHSTFPFESKNHWLGQCVTSPRAVADQVVDRYLLMTLVHRFQYRHDISEEIRQRITSLLDPWTPKNKRLVGNVLVFGDGERRNLTREEVHLVAQENIVGHIEAEVYSHIRVNGCHCRPQHHSIGIKSNDSLIYTEDNLFCEIQEIVLMGNEQGESVGLLCKQCNIGNNLNGVPHIVEVLDMDENVFVPAEEVRNSAMKITVLDKTYIMPMPHQNDID